MRSDRIVLILGAGASLPYGYPTGRALLREVVSELADERSRLHGFLSRTMGLDRNELMQLHDALRLGRQPSIDALIARRPEFTHVGRLALAFALLEREAPELLRDDDDPECRGGWYSYLFQRLDERKRDFASNASRVSIVTFNYDRSLEFAMRFALEHSYTPGTIDVEAELAALRIVHVYGDLDGSPAARMNRPYQRASGARTFAQAADGIYLLGDDRHRNPYVEEARLRILAAKKICFLGFAYHPDNLDLILPPGGWTEGTPQICGSAYGLPEDVRQQVVRRFDGRIALAGPEDDCLRTLQAFAVLS